MKCHQLQEGLPPTFFHQLDASAREGERRCVNDLVITIDASQQVRLASHLLQAPPINGQTLVKPQCKRCAYSITFLHLHLY